VRQNADVPGGKATGAGARANSRTMGKITDPAAFNDLVLTTSGGQPRAWRHRVRRGWNQELRSGRGL